MNIKEIVRIHLLEAQMSRETETFLTNKWKGMSPKSIKMVFDWFESTKPSFPLDPNKLEGKILTFLGWFNGSSPLREKFDIKNIRNIRAYSLNQIKRLWSEFKVEPLEIEGEENNLVVDSIFYKKMDGLAPSPETIANVVKNPDSVSDAVKTSLFELFDKSKDLWFGQQNLILSDGGFRVYNVPDQITSVAFGWYLYYIRYKYNFSGYNWCTTTPSSKNYFRGKRTDRSFYFIIDESKLPQTYDNSKLSPTSDELYYLSALQVMSPDNYERAKYKITPINNPGELIMDDVNLIKKYPKIESLLETDKLKFVRWAESDQISNENVDPVSLITEMEGSDYEFAVRPPNEKIEYINLDGRVLRRARSWRSMNDAMRQQYLDDTLTLNNMYDKFSNSELFKALSVSDRRSLDRKILRLTNSNVEGMGISKIIKNIMQNDFYVDERISLNKPHLSLYKSRSNSKFGIYNLIEDNWVKHNGVIYDDEYVELKKRNFYKTKDGKRFIVIIYSRTGQPDETSFYVVIPFSSGDTYDGYFVSGKMWNDLKVKLIEDQNPENTNVDFDPEKEGDIKENNNNY